ncbi:hypothetical protein ACMD2_26389 [Ananas comosus]|uniref:Uncharacterized protein n=1 Tax=Ananas comosus TaxID=4615 RepID=A0A199USH6_ANACO|nr:hypothetical protein ACMD2_26389 [Ananas comosus]
MAYLVYSLRKNMHTLHAISESSRWRRLLALFKGCSFKGNSKNEEDGVVVDEGEFNTTEQAVEVRVMGDLNGLDNTQSIYASMDSPDAASEPNTPGRRLSPR